MNDRGLTSGKGPVVLKRRALLGCGLGAAAAFGTSAVAPAARGASGASSPIAVTRQGQVQGYVDAGVLVFKGIPYGADTRQSRFKAPRPAAAWPRVRAATEYGPSAPQSNEASIDEDCLRLNVWTPALAGTPRAVMVYVHGGGFTSGSGSSPLYDGVRLCRRGDVVVVTVNHRLHALGYLFLQKLGGDAYLGGGNAGQLDLILALEWVRDNIAQFGGNPACVTLFGQSGGGAKIATLMAMPRAQGLFHRAITMSGQQVTAAGPNVSTLRAQVLLDALRISARELSKLDQLPVDVLLAALGTRDPALASGSLYFGPVVDDVSLPRHPFFPDAPPISLRVPMLLGNARDETRNLIGRTHPADFALSWPEVSGRIADELRGRTDIDADRVVREYRRMYPRYTPSEVFFAATSAGRSWRGQVIEAELRAAAQAPTWVYQVDFPSPLDGGRWRAAHTIDIPLAFDNTEVPDAITGADASARQMASRVSEAFIAFAKTGDPNHGALPHWPQYRLDTRATLIFDRVSRIENDPRAAERRLFASAPYVQPGS